MVIKQTLTGIALTTGLALIGCNGIVNDSRYDFDSKLGEEHVKCVRAIDMFFMGSGQDDLILNVKRKDGIVVIYTDLDNDLKLDQVKIGDKTYYKDAVGHSTLAIAQKQFGEYLEKILEHKQKEGIDLIS